MQAEPRQTVRRWRGGLDVFTSFVLIGAAVYIVYLNRITAEPGTIPVPLAPQTIGAAAAKGSDTAPVVMIAFSDFECPFCARFAIETLPALEHQFLSQGQLQLVFKPLPNHRNAVLAGVAAECAGQQNRFWPMHDELFGLRAKALTGEKIQSIAEGLGLDATAFNRCLASDIASKVSADATLAASLSIHATPGFLVGRRLPDGQVKVSRTLSGAQPLEEFQDVLESVLWEHRVRRAARNGAILAAPVLALAVLAVWRVRKRRVTTA